LARVLPQPPRPSMARSRCVRRVNQQFPPGWRQQAARRQHPMEPSARCLGGSVVGVSAYSDQACALDNPDGSVVSSSPAGQRQRANCFSIATPLDLRLRRGQSPERLLRVKSPPGGRALTGKGVLQRTLAVRRAGGHVLGRITAGSNLAWRPPLWTHAS